MLPEKIMQSDVLDILFENRNKSYGAYALRRSYNKAIASAITITIFIAIAFSVLQFIHHAHAKMHTISVIIPPDIVFDKVDPVKPQPETPVQPHAVSHSREVITSTPVIVPDDKKTNMLTVDDIDKSIVGAKNILGDDAHGEIHPPSNIQNGSGSDVIKPVAPKPDDRPLIHAQVMPEFPGGAEGLKKFMLRNLRQPDDFQAGEKIVVIASFIVNKNGEIERVKIINNGRPDLNKEVERVIGKMPFWKPGLQNGNPVAVYFNLPVTFVSAEE